MKSVERVLPRALGVWGLLMLAETVHGILRTLLVAPRLGDFPSRQLGVFTGSVMILIITWLLIRWIGASETGMLLGIGFGWVVLTLAFEIGLGRALGMPLEQLARDYDLSRGGLMPLGLLVLGLAPLIMARLRGIHPRRYSTYR